MKLVYIVGRGHVGSTLLELMLNAHPLVVSGGEIKVVHSAAQRGDKAKCTCGKPASTCPFWSSVSDALDRGGGPSLALIETKGSLTKSDVADNVMMLKTIRQLTGTEVIVDSSKSTRRLRALLTSPDLEVVPIVLYRDPRGQVFSEMRKRRSLLMSIYRFRHAYREIVELLAGRPHLFLRYEDLVASPEATLRALMQALGLGFDPKQHDWATSEHHGLGGNRMRQKRSADTPIIPDDEWQAGLSPLRQWLVKWATQSVRSEVSAKEGAHEVVYGSAAQVAKP